MVNKVNIVPVQDGHVRRSITFNNVHRGETGSLP